MTPIARLRAHTAPAHDMVDTAFGAHDLTDRVAYTAFLNAHARALPAAEQVLAGHHDLPVWRRRAELLAADLDDLDVPAPAPLPFVLPDLPGAAWGALYVVEGSRLGGIMLARGVPDSLPHRYLGARHLPGEWRGLLTAIDQAGMRLGDDWIAGVIAGADACFALYAQAAG